MEATRSPNCQDCVAGFTILSRPQALAKIKYLKAGSEEYAKLQDALVRTEGITEISLPDLTYKVDTCDRTHGLLGGFGSSEHMDIGESVSLPEIGKDEPLLVLGICKIRFSHIVALAGDFYGVAGQAISLPGGDDTEKTRRFEQAFETLAKASHSQVRKIIQEIEAENEAVRHSAIPHHCYSEELIAKNRAIESIKSDVGELLVDNSDHFSDNARDAYRIGHALAIRLAQEAGRKQDKEGLKYAYAVDAFACHFLTDLFAAGHIRNQRGALEKFLIARLGFSEKQAKPLAGILTGAQHEKDGKDGLNVINGQGQVWRAYGDGYYFTPKNRENKERVIQATQVSVGEVHEAFRNPDRKVESVVVSKFVPKADEYNPLPLYQVSDDGAKLTLFRGSKEMDITTKLDFLAKAIGDQALRYLPAKYVSGFLDPFQLELPPFVEKVLLPPIERLTGGIWHMVGLATYFQVREANEKIHSKLDEMASVELKTFENTIKMLEILEKLARALVMQSWLHEFGELRSAIIDIKDVIHTHKTYKPEKILPPQRAEIASKMWKAHVRFSRVFSEGNVDGKSLLRVYRKHLEQSEGKKSARDLDLQTTLWFREMLEYEFNAFNFYVLYSSIGPKAADERLIIQQQVRQFEESVILQIEHNAQFIVREFAYEERSYIQLQIDKSQVRSAVYGNFLT